MTTEMIKQAQTNLKFLFETVYNHDYSTEGLIRELNAVDYYLDRAADEAAGDENCLEIRQKCLNRKSTRIAELEGSYDCALNELRKMSDRCDDLCKEIFYYKKQNKIIMELLYGLSVN